MNVQQLNGFTSLNVIQFYSTFAVYRVEMLRKNHLFQKISNPILLFTCNHVFCLIQDLYYIIETPVFIFSNFLMNISPKSKEYGTFIFIHQSIKLYCTYRQYYICCRFIVEVFIISTIVLQVFEEYFSSLVTDSWSEVSCNVYLGIILYFAESRYF